MTNDDGHMKLISCTGDEIEELAADSDCNEYGWLNSLTDCRDEEDKCWTCGVSPAKNQTYRDALGEMELTCDSCHREEYPEKYDEEE